MTDYFRSKRRNELVIKKLLAKLPDDQLDAEERALKQRLDHMPRSHHPATHLPADRLMRPQAKDYEFSGTSMRDHWTSGYRDAERTLRHRDWLSVPTGKSGIVVHDIHRIDD